MELAELPGWCKDLDASRGQVARQSGRVVIEWGLFSPQSPD